MGTSPKFKPENDCLKCGRNMATMSWTEQQAHIQFHLSSDIESGKQATLD